MIFIPVGKTFVDIAMAINLAMSMVIVLAVLNLKRPADFTTFPRLVLMMTIFGTAINISSTRLILMNPATGTGHLSNQSELVQAFANIVARKNIVVGFFIFIVIIVFQMIVVTKGADRVSEVTARFTLDSMNNKMFNIQNQVNSGAITEEEGNLKIKRLGQEINFFSTMDGATKFVSGNVKFGIFVTVLNLVGGIIVGNRIGLGNAFKTYSILTIGDGLMSQVPGLLISLATGLLITGTEEETALSNRFRDELTVNGFIYVVVGFAFIVLGLVFHNGSSFILVPVGGFLIFVGYYLTKAKKAKEEAEKIQAMEAQNAPKKGDGAAEEISPVAKLDDLSLEIGYALIPLVDNEKGAELMSRVKRIRHECALDLGLVIPPIHIMDQMALQPEEYSFKIRGIEVGKGRLKMNHFMCLNTGGVPKDREMVGEKTKDPAFGMDAIWLPESKSLEAEKAGYAIIDAPTIIATHLTELIRSNAAKILSRQSVSAILEEIKKQNNVVVDEVTTGPEKFTYGDIEAVLKNLLEERVSIRNMVTILETLGDFGKITRNPWELTEKVREALGAQICQQFVDDNKVLRGLSIAQSLCEKILEKSATPVGGAPMVVFDLDEGRNFINAVSSAVAQMGQKYPGIPPIVFCPSEVRRLVKSATEREMPRLIVLSFSEIVNAGTNIQTEIIGEINV
ncbi:flagellar biosynthesis protein FlhA [Treponema sp.]|uniref:flagellar biosynthesis protein FlhA n=1 Tax=Treponema sp. TaxID=166 RepID=UPI00298E609D|nr:flagellar biosynthesis protein FlhA [Treponema sp.]MCQ2242013.1 flagellar biosynthesis protein FlhA [Treponema sp.]